MRTRNSIKALMALRKTKKRDISEELGIPWNTINRYLSGQNDISSDKFVRILQYLEVDLVDIINDKINDLLNEQSLNREAFQNLYYILGALDDIERKVHLDDLIVSANRSYEKRPEPQLRDAIKKLQELYRV